MSHVSKQMLLDCSTPDEFCFALRCAECGELIKSTPLRFSRSGVKPTSDEKQTVYNTLYRIEKEAALERAAAELKTIFNFCPVCRRVVCDHCFLVCDDLDMCSACAGRLKEYGEPVGVRAI